MPHLPFIRRYLAEKITLQKMAGTLSRISSVLAKSSIELNPYQIQAAIYTFNSPLQRGAILADEVGLGKTIEAGIIISQLWAEGKRRILIITPASLRKQWQDELSNKFGLNTEVYDSPSFNEKVNNGEKVPLTYDGIFIASYHFVYSHLALAEKQPWNLVLIDEAHRMRRVYRGRDASKMAYEIRKIITDKPKVLLTATPLQNNLMELYGIVSFIDDKLLGNDYSFKTRYVDPLSEINDNRTKLQELRSQSFF
ncbi:MAG: DEAD/DEAH box helicase [Nitrospinota bacterium]|mgnify:FL=1